MEKQIYGVIYYFRNKINGKLYCGQTINTFEGRYRNDENKIINSVSNDHFKRSIKKYGISNFEINKNFDIAYSKEELDALEDMYICIYNTINPKYGYNKKRGGANPIPNEETRKKLSESHKGSPHLVGEANPFYGRKHTDETRRKMSESHYDCKGEKHPQYGTHRSDTTKEKVSKGLKEYNEKLKESGVKRKDSLSRRKPVLCITTGKAFRGKDEAAEYYNIRSNNIGNVCLGKQSYCGKLEDGTKLVWKYITIDEYECLKTKEGGHYTKVSS